MIMLARDSMRKKLIMNQPIMTHEHFRKFNGIYSKNFTNTFTKLDESKNEFKWNGMGNPPKIMYWISFGMFFSKYFCYIFFFKSKDPAFVLNVYLHAVDNN